MREIRALTGIRGIAAVTVFLAHTLDTLNERGLELHPPSVIARLFLASGRQVDIFFVLSGFILAMIYESWFDSGVARKQYLEFLKRRLARIYPLHAFIVLLVLGFVAAASLLHLPVLNGTDRFSLATLPATLLLVHAWGFAGPDGGPWNPPSWSISIEALAYLLFPGFMWATVVLRRSRPWASIAAVALCGFGLNWITPWGLAGFPGISRGLSEFALGCMLIGVGKSSIANWFGSTRGATVAFVILVVCFALTPDTGFVIALVIAPILLALCGSNWLSRFYGWTPVYFLGEISYSIYLGHFLFSSIAYRAVNVSWMRTGLPQAIAGIIEITVLVVLMSTATYYLIERPGRDWLSGRRRRLAPALIASSK